jgi:hypothetical protein
MKLPIARTSSLLLSLLLGAVAPVPAQQGRVQVEPLHLEGPRALNEQTQAAVVRDYLESWQSLSGALTQNRPELLDRDFVGTAKDKLLGTIHDQVTLGITSRYVDRNHDLQVLFYSPEGLSIQLIDTAQYDVQVFDHGKPMATQHATVRYVVVMTPAEVRWRVRVLQEQPE